jgi:lipoprotein-releasing system permease protein
MKLSFNIAVKFLKSNISQTLIIILGIGIGISVQIFIGSLIQGLQKGLVEKTIGSSSQITIAATSQDKLIFDYIDLMETAQLSDSRIKSISPAYDNAGLMEYDGKSQSLLIRGLDFSKADKLYKISDSIVEGTMPTNPGEVLLGKNLIEEYGFNVGDNITIITPDKTTKECKITGFFDLKVAQINNSWCITSLSSAQEIFSAKDAITSIEMQVAEDDVFDTDIITQNIALEIGNDDYKITDWKSQNEQLLSGLQGQSISSLMIQIFVMISVVLGIASVLAITVIQKSKQIGILKAMGIKNSASSLIFLFEGLILGVFGAIAGILLGLGLSAAFTAFALNPDGTPVVALYIDSNFIALSGLIAILSCIIASFIPAVKSSKLNPIDIIRNN